MSECTPSTSINEFSQHKSASSSVADHLSTELFANQLRIGQKEAPQEARETSKSALSTSLTRIETVSDIEDSLNGTLSQLATLEKLETRWMDINTNLESVLIHLQESSDQVTKASVECTKSLSNAVGTACDQIDSQMRALYHLITKCDELTTRLSASDSFRDEIKTLRKSVETLEGLYKTRPQPTRELP